MSCSVYVNVTHSIHSLTHSLALRSLLIQMSTLTQLHIGFGEKAVTSNSWINGMQKTMEMMMRGREKGRKKSENYHKLAANEFTLKYVGCRAPQCLFLRERVVWVLAKHLKMNDTAHLVCVCASHRLQYPIEEKTVQIILKYLKANAPQCARTLILPQKNETEHDIWRDKSCLSSVCSLCAIVCETQERRIYTNVALAKLRSTCTAAAHSNSTENVLLSHSLSSHRCVGVRVQWFDDAAYGHSISYIYTRAARRQMEIERKREWALFAETN